MKWQQQPKDVTWNENNNSGIQNYNKTAKTITNNTNIISSNNGIDSNQKQYGMRKKILLNKMLGKSPTLLLCTVQCWSKPYAQMMQYNNDAQ